MTVDVAKNTIEKKKNVSMVNVYWVTPEQNTVFQNSCRILSLNRKPQMQSIFSWNTSNSEQRKWICVSIVKFEFLSVWNPCLGKRKRIFQL